MFRLEAKIIEKKCAHCIVLHRLKLRAAPEKVRSLRSLFDTLRVMYRLRFSLFQLVALMKCKFEFFLEWKFLVDITEHYAVRLCNK